MNGLCDLHVHSTYSDGTLSPKQLINLAEALKLSAIALCDHNTISGLEEFIHSGREASVEAIPGIEFSVDYLGSELHILGLFIKPEYFGAITEKLNEMLILKESSNESLVAALCAAGIAIDYSAVKSNAPGGYVNRAVIASHMVQLGYCSSIKQALKDFLSEENGYYKPPRRPDAFEIIRFIKSIGAVAVLAHPFLNLDEVSLCRFLKQAKQCGLDAIEALYPKFSKEQTQCLLHIADEYGLLISGGSDYHGENKPDIQMGTGKDNLYVPVMLLERLKLRRM